MAIAAKRERFGRHIITTVYWLRSREGGVGVFVINFKVKELKKHKLGSGKFTIIYSCQNHVLLGAIFLWHHVKVDIVAVSSDSVTGMFQLEGRGRHIYACRPYILVSRRAAHCCAPIHVCCLQVTVASYHQELGPFRLLFCATKKNYWRPWRAWGTPLQTG